VVIDDLHVDCIAFAPDEAQPVLIVDPNAVLALAVSGKRHEMISAWNRQIKKPGGPMEDKQLLERDIPYVGWNPAALARLPKKFSVGVFEALDQELA
jgi:hypothetical protein